LCGDHSGSTKHGQEKLTLQTQKKKKNEEKEKMIA